MRCSKIAIIMIIGLTLAVIAVQPVEARGDILVFKDSRVEPVLLYPYTLRLLVVRDTGNGTCFTRGLDGRLILVCNPVQNTTVKATYLEIGEVSYANTNDEGVAELSFRIMTPKATFRVEVLGNEVEFTVSANPLGLLTVAAFASMVAALVVFLRRGFW